MKRIMFVIAMLFVVLFAASGTASAQETYDVKISSADDGLPDGGFAFGVEFNTGETQELAFGEEGVYPFPVPPGAKDVVAVHVFGIRYPVTSRNLLCIPWGNGCWCLCLRWTNYFPPLRWPRLFWYYNPCCP